MTSNVINLKYKVKIADVKINLTQRSKMDLKRYLETQNSEIQRHKWIESEKAGKDLGVDAVIDWIKKYADAFSEDYYNNNNESES